MLPILIFILVLADQALAQNTVIQVGGSRITPIADVTVTGTATLIQDADPQRITLSCTNTSSSVNVRWGSSSVTASTGQRIPFGTAIEIRNIGAIYMISEGANVTVACTKEAR